MEPAAILAKLNDSQCYIELHEPDGYVHIDKEHPDCPWEARRVVRHGAHSYRSLGHFPTLTLALETALDPDAPFYSEENDE